MGNHDRKAAVGFRTHSGWAVLMAVAGSPRAPTILERRRIDLADSTMPVQPYHAAEGLELKEAERLIDRCQETSRRLARLALQTTIENARQHGYGITACGVLESSARPLPLLAEVLRSHALIHTAEGEMYRNAVSDAGARHNLRIVKVKEREILERSAEGLGIASGELQRQLSDFGRKLGPPWRQDEKFATLAAWLALAARD